MDLQDVPDLGIEGDQVIVNGGYMRNYLHPEKKAVYAPWSNKPKTIRVSPDTEVGLVLGYLFRSAEIQWIVAGYQPCACHAVYLS